MGTLVTSTFCIAISEITETVEAETKIGLLMLAEIKSVELTTQMAVTSTGRKTSRTCKQFMDIIRLTKLMFFKMMNVLLA